MNFWTTEISCTENRDAPLKWKIFIKYTTKYKFILYFTVLLKKSGFHIIYMCAFIFKKYLRNKEKINNQIQN